MYPITINKIDNGVLVKVGCKTLAYQKNQYKMLAEDIKGYLEDPDKTQKAVFKRWGIKAGLATGSDVRFNPEPCNLAQTETR